MPSTTTYEPGVVVVVRVLFTGQAGAKLRPAVVVSTAPFHRKLPDILVCPISSQPRYFKRPGVGDLPLLHWRTAGLRRPSTARLSNLLAVEKRIIKRALGRLHAEDLASVQQALRRAFGL